MNTQRFDLTSYSAFYWSYSMNEETLLLTFEFKYLFLYSFNYFSKGFLFVVVAKTKKIGFKHFISSRYYNCKTNAIIITQFATSILHTD